MGPYEILSAIGAGGMGEVYRARDTRLERIVAVKILPDHLSDRTELRERFEREARAIASLNHPHISTLHDIGHQDGTDFLVMEYLEGETLAERLKKGPLPLDQVLQYAIEISDALDKAHRKGITHRDLKPSNIMLTKAGTKLLDFGLAKLRQDVAPATPLSQLPTAKEAITAQGTILGTLQYMAPEQVEGKTKEIDARTDIFAFGAVVYEMATGKKAFEGKTSASVMAKILEVDPPSMVSLQPMTPPQLDRVVKTCLAKDPDSRWQTASDLCRELKWIAEGGSQVTLTTTAGAKGIRVLGQRQLILSMLGALLLGAAITGLALWNLKPSPPQHVSRFVMNLPPGQQLAGVDEGPEVALSPDDTHLAYVAGQVPTQQIYLRAMDSLEAKPVPGTQGGVSPFFSPDGQWVGFFSGGKLKKVSISGGGAVSLVDAGNTWGASWGSAGIIAFASPYGSPLQQVSDAGGTAQTLARLEKGENQHDMPEFLPSGKAVLFDAWSGDTFNTSFQASKIVAHSVVTGERRNLIQGAAGPRYVSSGHLIYVQGESLMAVPFDPQRLAVTGAAVPVVEGILQSSQWSVSAKGSLVYVPGTTQSDESSKLVWVSRTGAEQPVAAPAHIYATPRLSPDHRRVAVVIRDQEGSQVWLYDLLRETLTRFTFEGTANYNPVWTPDSKRIAFNSNKEGPMSVFWQPADGSGGIERLTTSEFGTTPRSFSADGQLLAFVELNPTTRRGDISVLRLSDRKLQPFLRTQFDDFEPQFSPDGHWLAYVSDESGRDEIYVRPYAGPGGKLQISTEGGEEPMWNPNGRELFYRTGGGRYSTAQYKMMAVDISTQPVFTAGKPHVLFEGRYEPGQVLNANYAVSPDGQRFLMLKASEQAGTAATQIVVVQNWFEELKQKVPTGKK